MATDKDTIAERNARGSARGRYFEWLYRRFRNVQLLELIDSEPGHINLQQIFAPLRAAQKDMDEERMTGPDKVNKETLPGHGVWDLLGQEPFMALSGRPGSGKTTLVHAIVLELCGQRSSDLRKKLSEYRGMAPVPLILRNLPGLESVQTLNELLDIWWCEAEIQGKADHLPLDIPRLKASFDRDKEAYPALLMFDGIDEAGGPEIRSRILQMAAEAANRGFRVLVTGRPTGFQDLPELNGKVECMINADSDVMRSSKEKLYHVLPFAWEQIQRFIRHWYHLRNDWKRKREAGIENFLDALQNPRRSYLLTLARRPIFLTLMALVHCSRNEMPDGRGALYKAIIDLYLVRQEKHRQLKETTDGTPMPHWPDTEKRMVLGYLAYQSQIKGSEQEKDDDDKLEKRRVVWERQAMLQTIREQLSSRKYGRFTELQPEDAEELLKYFLHPAGLLTEPEEERIQFAHLSFQEYLCADFLSGRARKEYLESELFARLEKPGWDEVGMLLLTIRAEQERNEGHFEILAWLDLVDVEQADLFIKAYTGRELPFTDVDIEEWLPVAMGCALVHPDSGFVSLLARLPETTQIQGIELLIQMFEAENAENQWDVLLNRLEQMSPVCIEQCLKDHPISDQLKKRWLNPKDDAGWAVGFDIAEARTYALLNLIAETGWARNKSKNDKIEALVLPSDGKLTEVIIGWFQKNIKIKAPDELTLLWSRQHEDDPDALLPVPTHTALALDALLPGQGDLWQEVIRCIPPDAWLLQGESAEYFSIFNFEIISQAVVLLVLYPEQTLSVNALLALGLYQVIMILEGSVIASAFDGFTETRSRYMSKSKSEFRSLSLSQFRSLSLSRSRSRSRSRSLSRTMSWSRSWSLSWSRSMFISLPMFLYEFESLFRSFKNNLEKINKVIEKHEPSDETTEPFYLELEHFIYRDAAHDWFNEQADNPNLMCRRGLRPGEPLPKELGLFDNDGRPLPVQKRENWVRLRQWLDDDDAVLEFFFPEGLPASER